MKSFTSPKNQEETRRLFDGIPAKGELILSDNPAIESYRKDAVITGSPDALVRPRDFQEVSEIVAWCNANAVPLTLCGSRTSMTGSSVANGGLLLALEKFNHVLDVGVRNGKPYAVTEPGVIVSEFQKEVAAKGFCYPTVPTSVGEAMIGSTVATNATGEDFYKYGPTRNYVREISLIKADGSRKIYRRPENDFPFVSKGRGGYYLNGSEIDLLIGSEGTLGVIERVVFDLLPGNPDTFIIIVPFESDYEALKFIDSVNKLEDKPRSMELIDSFGLSIIKRNKGAPKFTEDVRSIVYFKDEYSGSSEERMSKWFLYIENYSKHDGLLFDETIVSQGESDKSKFKEWRHLVPSTIKEMHEALQKQGGGKVEGDWWVPRDKMLKMMEIFYKDSNLSGLEYTAYGHLGDGHPHTDYFARNSAEKEKAKALVKRHCKIAVEFGGGVAAEHGIGKIKTDLLPIQYNETQILQMRKVKESFDPNWILGRGNILIP